MGWMVPGPDGGARFRVPIANLPSSWPRAGRAYEVSAVSWSVTPVIEAWPPSFFLLFCLVFGGRKFAFSVQFSRACSIRKPNTVHTPLKTQNRPVPVKVDVGGVEGGPRETVFSLRKHNTTSGRGRDRGLPFLPVSFHSFRFAFLGGKPSFSKGFSCLKSPHQLALGALFVETGPGGA